MPLQKARLINSTGRNMYYFVQYFKRHSLSSSRCYKMCNTLFIIAWWRKPVPFEIWDKIMHIPSNVWSVNCLFSMAFNYLTSSFSFRILRCSLSTLLESDLKLLYWNNVGTELATNGGFPLSPNSSACKMSSSITTNQMLVM